MTKKYRLKKDLPGLEAGTILESRDGKRIHYHLDDWNTFTFEYRSDWFEEVKEEKDVTFLLTVGGEDEDEEEMYSVETRSWFSEEEAKLLKSELEARMELSEDELDQLLLYSNYYHSQEENDYEYNETSQLIEKKLTTILTAIRGRKGNDDK